MPMRLQTSRVDLCCLSAFLGPNQDIPSFLSLELARGKRKIPSYTPYIAPRISDPPVLWHRWDTPRLSHEGVSTRARQSATPPQGPP